MELLIIIFIIYIVWLFVGIHNASDDFDNFSEEL